MPKYRPFEQRRDLLQKAVEDVRQDGSIRAVAKKFRLSPREVSAACTYAGVESKRRGIPDPTITKAVNLVLAEGVTQTEAAKRFNVHPRAINERLGKMAARHLRSAEAAE